MSEWDHKHEGAARQDGEPGIDRELDAVLAKYASIEPRVGLEERVLANLRADRQPTLQPWIWRPFTAVTALTALAAILLLVLTWSLESKSGRPEPHNMAQRTSQQPPAPVQTTAQTSWPGVSAGERSAARPRESDRQRLVVAQRSAARQGHPPVVVATQPKLDQFPSPRPLSEQERMLASYVANYPETAALVAQARAKALQKEMEEEADANAPDSIR